jgi:hypothetical protein
MAEEENGGGAEEENGGGGKWRRSKKGGGGKRRIRKSLHSPHAEPLSRSMSNRIETTTDCIVSTGNPPV